MGIEMRNRSELFVFALICLGMVAGYLWMALPAVPQYGLLKPEQQHFNQLVAGFRSGQLSLKQLPDPELAKLADPYDPIQNFKYQFHDASYYQGKYYIYYGVAPALILFWPYVAVTGSYLAQKYAVFIFCSAGFLIGAALVWQVRRRCFPRVGPGTLYAMVLAVGSVDCVFFQLRRPEMYEVSTSCAFATVMAALAAVWCCLGDGRRPLLSMTLASLFFALAVASRPTFLFGAACLLVPLAAMLGSAPGRADGGRFTLKLGAAALAPLVSIGIGLAAYNYLRFGNPLEFGIKYLLMDKKVSSFFVFNWHYIWLNVRLYFLIPARLMEYFPFVRDVVVPAVDDGYGFTEDPFGVFTNIPFLLLAFAAPLAWRNAASGEARRLRLFASAVGWVFLTSVAVLMAYIVASIRYEMDFAPYLTILAVLGVFGMEEHFSSRPRWRGLARLGWIGLLAVSVAFNFFGSCQHLSIFERQATAEYKALSQFFNYPVYALNRVKASLGAAPAHNRSADEGPVPHQFGPVLIRIKAPPAVDGVREPLVVMGTTPGVSAIAFIRSAGRGQVIVGIQFTGLGVYECRPIKLEREGPVDITVAGPALLPDLGESPWRDVPYLEQLSQLGRYSISVNGVAVLWVSGLLDRPIDREAPLLLGVNPVKDTAVSSAFTGEIIAHSRLGAGGEPSAD
jgi:hypothetical protein